MDISQAIAAYKVSNSDRDLLIMSVPITRELHTELTRELEEKKKHEFCTVFLTTYGGDPHAGYRIARCLRHHYKHLRLVIPSSCKSAGTLIAIAVDELSIGDLGELGPLDIQVSKPSEFQENSSGLDIQQALQMILEHAQQAFRRSLLDIRHGGRLSTRLAGEFASQIAVGIVEPLYAQIDPNRIGELQRAMQITNEYGERLNRYANNLKEGALQKLVAGYPSHSFVIDRKEAKDLFKSVSHLTPEEEALSMLFWERMRTVTNLGPILINLEQTNTGSEHGENISTADVIEFPPNSINTQFEIDGDAETSDGKNA